MRELVNLTSASPSDCHKQRILRPILEGKTYSLRALSKNCMPLHNIEGINNPISRFQEAIDKDLCTTKDYVQRRSED